MTIREVEQPRADAPSDAMSPADMNLLRRADAAGQRLFRELVVTRIAWATISEVSRLIAVDVVGFSLRAAGCAHPPPCNLRHCLDRLEMKAVIGNRSARLPGLFLAPGAGVGGRALAEARPMWVADYGEEGLDRELVAIAAGEEGIGALLAVPVSFGGEVRGVLHAGLRRSGEFGSGTIEALSRVCAYAGAALAAAYDRARVEEVAALRERRRMTRALHDELGQRLFAVGVSARLARESATTGRPDLLSHLHRLEQEVAHASGSLRQALRGLDRAPTAVGSLAVTLREDVSGFSTRTAIPAHLIVLGDQLPSHPGRDSLLVAVAREGLRNVERHAAADEVVVTLCVEASAIELVVQDDGRGARGDVELGLGLLSLRRDLERRGGRLSLVAHEDLGATLRASLPLER